MTTAVQVSTVSTGWQRALLALATFWLFTGWVFRDTLLSMVAIWNRSETFTHAWIVPPIAFWLMWRLRAAALAITPRASPWTLLLIAVTAAVWLTGEAAAVATTTQFALVAMMVLAVPALLGWQVASVWAFPLGFMFFCVPFGEFLSPTLMVWTADFTVAALRATGIPVYQEGLQFVIPSGRWSVVEACSGIRYLIASIMVGTLFAYLNYNALRRRLIFVGISILVPLVANWLRAYMIVMLGHLSGNELAVGADHLLYGWIFFGVVILALYWIGARWAEELPATPPFQPASGPWSLGRGGFVAVTAAVLVMSPLWLWQKIEASTSAALVELRLPLELPGNWRQADDPAPRWKPGFLNPVASQRTAYRRPDGVAMGVYVAYYRGQGPDRKLVSSTNRMVHSGDDGWQLVSQNEREVKLASGLFSVRDGVVLQPEIMGAAPQRLRIWQTYWVDGGYVANDIRAKVKGALSRLLGRGDDSAVVLVFTDQVGNADDKSLTDFLSQALPALTDALDAPRRAEMSK